MLILVSLMMNLSYMIHPVLGFFITTTGLYLMYQASESLHKDVRLFLLLIFVIPLLGVNIISRNLPHLLNWYYILLFAVVLYLCFCAKHIRVITKYTLCVLFVLECCILLHKAGHFNLFILLTAMRESFILIAYFLAFDYLYYQKKFTVREKNYLINSYINVAVGTALAMAVQFVLFQIFKIRIGNITTFPGRTVYDVLFNAYSSLSVYLASAMMLCCIKLEKKFERKNIFKVVILLCMLPVNTSRSGMAAFVVTYVLYRVVKFLKHRTKKVSMKELAIPIMIILISFVGMKVLEKIRNINMLSGLMRIQMVKDAMHYILKDIGSFLFGTGTVDIYKKIMIPHNFFFEHWLYSGLLFAVFLLSFFLYTMYQRRQDKAMFGFATAFIGGQFFTGILLTPYLFPLFLLMMMRTQPQINGKVKT